MTDDLDADHADLDAVATDLRESQLVYGAVLAEERVHVIECVDAARFENSEDDADVAMLTALAMARRELGDFIDESESELAADLGKTAAPHLNSERKPPRVTDFERAAGIVPEARACFLLYNTEGQHWERVRDAYPDQFDEHDALAGILVIAFTLVDEARERIRQQPLDVRTTVEDIVENLEW